MESKEERNKKLFEMRNASIKKFAKTRVKKHILSFDKLGEEFGISGGRARQLYNEEVLRTKLEK